MSGDRAAIDAVAGLLGGALVGGLLAQILADARQHRRHAQLLGGQQAIERGAVLLLERFLDQQLAEIDVALLDVIVGHAEQGGDQKRIGALDGTEQLARGLEDLLVLVAEQLDQSRAVVDRAVALGEGDRALDRTEAAHACDETTEVVQESEDRLAGHGRSQLLELPEQDRRVVRRQIEAQLRHRVESPMCGVCEI